MSASKQDEEWPVGGFLFYTENATKPLTPDIER